MLKSWLPVAPNSDFPLENIPFGIFSPESAPDELRAGTIIGNTVIDLQELLDLGYFDDYENFGDIYPFVFQSECLNDFIAEGKAFTRFVRKQIQTIFAAGSDLEKKENELDILLYDADEVIMHLPVMIGDYTDFYSSRQHATNVGMMFRDPANALLPNWLHIPVGYHGRASSIVVSCTDVVRPLGQRLPQGAEVPVFGASQLLDFELEVAFIVGAENAMGERVSTADAEDYIFGLTLFNDWSARDIQAWEYVPLGPFLGKNFASSMSAWVVTLDALNEFRVAGPAQTDPQILPYLEYEGKKHFDIALEVAIQTPAGDEKIVSNSNFKNMYWNMVQQLAHHTVGGCPMRIGDVCASGTISGDTPESYGSMLEITWRGSKPITMPDGTERKFINDGDTVVMRGFAEKDGVRIGFGDVSGKILPALPL